jgi:tetratricopeptide (TPR) repeat protein
MSYLLEALGRGLVQRLTAIFDLQLPRVAGDSAALLEERLSQSPKSLDLCMRLGAQYLRDGRLGEAQRVFQRAATLADCPRMPAIGLACVYDELGDGVRAVESLKRARGLDPRDPAIAFALGLCHERSGAIAAARSAYRSALSLSPTLRNAYERLAAIALREDEPDEALACYEELAEMTGDDLDVLLTLGALYLQNHRPADALERFQLALLVEPETDDPALPDVGATISENRLNAAIRTLERLVAKCPTVAGYRVRLGDLYARKGAAEDALREYQAALAIQPNMLEATVKLGTQHLRSGRILAAAHSFHQATELNDRLTLAFVALGVAQQRCGVPNEAQSSFDLAASVEPSSTLLMAETTRLHLRAVRGGSLRPDAAVEEDGGLYDGADAESVEATLEEVVQRHRRALAANRQQPDLHYRYGVLLRQCGRVEDARRSFEHCVRLNPNFTKAQIRLGLCLREAGARDASQACFERAVDLSPATIATHYQLGLLFTQPNKFDLACEEFSASQSRPPGEFQAALENALHNLGLLDPAATTWRTLSALAHDPDNQLQFRRESVLKRAIN